ncbi:MAG: hypothetical protein E7652_03485 [Ruminococcaceae bacterium]|nr:hypothetical protein [Oscillospiraceae bacterium]
MGTWNSTLFSNDTACDVKDTYIELLKQQLNNDEAYKKVLDEYKELIGTDEEAIFWYALADTQWSVGRLTETVKSHALKFISESAGSELWEDDPKSFSKYLKMLDALKEKLSTPMPSEKKFNKQIDFIRNPWNLGDIYSYQFHTEYSKEYGFYGKYIIFQKIGDIEYYKDTLYSIIQVFDKIFDSIPTLNELENIRTLPSIPPAKEYLYPLEKYTRIVMEYNKKNTYPHKHLMYIGNVKMPNINYNYKDCDCLDWAKDSMEEWLIDSYLGWNKQDSDS